MNVREKRSKREKKGMKEIMKGEQEINKRRARKKQNGGKRSMII